MATHSTFICDAPDGCESGELERQEVIEVTLNSPSVEGGNSIKHLCRAVHEDEFMNGTISGADLFLQD